MVFTDFPQRHFTIKERRIQEKAMETTTQKRARRENPRMPKPEEQEGMPQHQQCPLAKRRKDKNPKYHEEEQKHVA
jgi:hypothetical protein